MKRRPHLRKTLVLWLRLLLGLVLPLTASAPGSTQAPQRVVTVNLCLDQIALRLAAPGQLAGVSMLSHDPRLSVLVDQARVIAPVRPSVEAILALRPDLVIFDAVAQSGLKDLVRRAGVAVLEVPWAASLAEAETLFGQIAAALGRLKVGRAVVADMRRQRSGLASQSRPVALAAVLQANGATTGKGSLMGELLHLAGFRNLAAEPGIPAYGRWSLETVLAGRPDLLVIDAEANLDPARATEFVDHAALRSLAGKAHVVSVPTKYAICAGPENFHAIRLLAEARR